MLSFDHIHPTSPAPPRCTPNCASTFTCLFLLALTSPFPSPSPKSLVCVAQLLMGVGADLKHGWPTMCPKTDSWTPSNCRMPAVPPLGLDFVFSAPFHAGIFSGLSLCSSSSCCHSHCEDWGQYPNSIPHATK